MREVADVKHPEKMSVSRDLHIILKPAGYIIAIAANYESVLPHLFEWRMRPRKIALDPLAMRKRAVAVQPRHRRRIVDRTREDPKEIADRLTSFFDRSRIGFRDVDQPRADELVMSRLPGEALVRNLPVQVEGVPERL